MENRTKIEISTWTVIKVFLIALVFYLLFFIRDIIALLFIVLILVATFSPVVKNWQKKIGRVLSIISLFILLLIIFATVFYIIIPPLVNQVAELANSIPQYIADTNFDSLRQYTPEIRKTLENLSANLGLLTSNIFTLTAGIIGGIFTILMIIVLTFYMLLDEANIREYISSLFSPKHKESGIGVINKIAYKIGSWFQGQIFLGIIVFIIDFIGLSIIGVPYALILALIAGLLEIIPTVGPFISGAIAALFALTISPWKALFVVIYYLAVQIIENNILVPKIMQKAVGISPVVIIVAILIGAKLMGIVGAILAIPLAASLSVIILEWPTISKIFSRD